MSMERIWPQIISHSALPADLDEFIKQFKLTLAYETLTVSQRLTFQDLDTFVRLAVMSGDLPSDLLYSYLIYFFKTIKWKPPV